MAILKDSDQSAENESAAASRDENFECGYYDVQLVQQISKALLLSLGMACVERTTGDPFATPKSVSLDVRKEMADYLCQQCQRYVIDTSAQCNPVHVIEGFLENFVRSKRTLLRKVSNKFLGDGGGGDRRDDRIDAAVTELDRSGAWPVSRRDTLSRALLKQIHDNAKSSTAIVCNCRFGSLQDLMLHKLKCSFRPVDCSSHGCDAILSAARSGEHEGMCLFKLLPCEQKCGAMVMRGEMAMHCDSACEMRPVGCPFAAVGCAKRIPQAQIHRHCEQEMGSHLLSVLQLLQQLDNTAHSQSQRIVLLEKAVCIAQGFEGVDMASLILALRNQEAKIQSLEQELSKLRNEVKVTDVSAEVLQLRRELRSVQRRMDTLPLLT